MAIVLSGKELSEQLTREQTQRVKELAQQGIHPGLAVVLVGEDPASQIYVRNKGIACETIGIHSVTIRLDADITQEALEAKIGELKMTRLIKTEQFIPVSVRRHSLCLPSLNGRRHQPELTSIKGSPRHPMIRVASSLDCVGLRASSNLLRHISF